MHTINADSRDRLGKNKIMHQENKTRKKRNALRSLIGRLFWNMKIDQKALRDTMEITFWK